MTPRLKHYSFWQTGHCHPFSTWQAGQTRKGSLLCKQCPDGRFLQNACWDEFPNPKIAQVRLRVQRRFFIFSKQASQFFLNNAVAANCNYRSLSFTPSAVFQSTLPLDVCPKITADAADGALNS